MRPRRDLSRAMFRALLWLSEPQYAETREPSRGTLKALSRRGLVNHSLNDLTDKGLALIGATARRATLYLADGSKRYVRAPLSLPKVLLSVRGLINPKVRAFVLTAVHYTPGETFGRPIYYETDVGAIGPFRGGKKL